MYKDDRLQEQFSHIFCPSHKWIIISREFFFLIKSVKNEPVKKFFIVQLGPRAMRTLILLALLSTLLAASGALQIRQISLRVDHFNPLDRRTFESRYFMNDEFYTPGGPIFSKRERFFPADHYVD